MPKKKKIYLSAVAFQMAFLAFFAAAVVMLSGAPVFAQQGQQTMVTGVLTAEPRTESATPVYAIIDATTGRPYLLISTAVVLGDYVGQRVTISGRVVPPPTGRPDMPRVLNVTQVQAPRPTVSETNAKQQQRATDQQKQQAAAKEAAEKKAAKQEEQLSLEERVAEKLRENATGNIAFNTPEEMQVGRTDTVELLLSQTLSAEELKEQLTETGVKEGEEEIPTAAQMQARLSGDPTFTIQAITEEEQAISSEENKWSWDVTPTQAGEEQKLHLTITALLELEGTEGIKRHTIDTYDRTIVVKEVQKSWGQRVSEFIGNNWQWLWATLLAPIALWAHRTYKNMKAAKRGSDAA